MQSDISYCPPTVGEVLIDQQIFPKAYNLNISLLLLLERLPQHQPSTLTHNPLSVRKQTFASINTSPLRIPQRHRIVTLLPHSVGMAFLTAPQTPAGRRVIKYFKALEKRSSKRKQHSELFCSPASRLMIKSLTYTLTVGRMSKHIESKDHTIRRLRGQRNFLRRVAQAPVKGDQESEEEELRRKSSPSFKCNSHMFY